MKFNVKGKISAKVNFDGGNLVIDAGRMGYVEARQDGKTVRKIQIDGFYEVDGLWNKFLKFADGMIVWGKHKDIYIDTEGKMVKLAVYYKNYEVHAQYDVCALSMKGIDFYAFDEGLYVLLNKEPVGFFGRMENAKNIFKKRYFERLIKWVKKPEVRSLGGWFYVNDMKFSVGRCVCGGDEAGIVIFEGFDVNGFYEWVLWVVENEKLDEIGWDEKTQRYKLRYGNLSVRYTKDYRFWSASYECRCAKIELIVFSFAEFFRFDVNKNGFVCHFNGKMNVHSEFCRKLENSKATRYLKIYIF